MAVKTNILLDTSSDSNLYSFTLKHIKHTSLDLDAVGPCTFVFPTYSSWPVPGTFVIDNISYPLTILKIRFSIPDILGIYQPRFYKVKLNGLDVDPDRTNRMTDLIMRGDYDSAYFKLINIFSPITVQPGDILSIKLGTFQINRHT